MSGWTAGAIAGSAVIGGIASSSAAREQSKAADRATAEQRRQFERQVELQEPFRQAGVNALPELIEASRYTPFSMEQFRQSPSYGFRLKKGLEAMERTAAARGGLLSGNQLRGAMEYGGQLGMEDYNNAFNQYQIERAARLNPLQSLAGMGQTAANTLSNEAGQYGNTMAQNAAQMGNIRASSYMGGANALTGGIGQYLNYRQNQDMMKMYGPRQYAEPTFEQATLDDFSQQQYPGQRNP